MLHVVFLMQHYMYILKNPIVFKIAQCSGPHAESNSGQDSIRPRKFHQRTVKNNHGPVEIVQQVKEVLLMPDDPTLIPTNPHEGGEN